VARYNYRMNYRLILFDFDGTLADSQAESIRIFQEIGPKLGLKPFVDLEAARQMPTREALKKIGVTFWKLPKVVRAYQAAAAARAGELKLHAGIFETLNQLHSAGVRLAVLSSNREDNIRKCLAANNVEHLFEFVVGHPQLFGKARAIRKIYRRLRMERQLFLYVGDETRDIEAAHAAKIPVVAVGWGFHTLELLGRYQPTFTVQAPQDLIPVALGQGG
jgi:phosphoglycolate phosphatase